MTTTKQAGLVADIFKAGGDLLAAGQTGDVFSVLQSLDRSIAVLETMREMVEVGHPLHQEVRDKIAELTALRLSLTL